MNKTVFIMQTLQYLVLYFIFRIFWSDSTWYQNKEKELFFVLVTYILYLIFSWITYFRRPLVVEVIQSNNLSSGIVQTLIVQDSGRIKTDQSQRTVRLELKVSRRKSLWWWPFIWFIKGKDLFIEVEPIPDGVTLQANDHLRLDEIASTIKGFNIDIANLVNGLHRQIGNLTIGKTYLYTIPDHEEIVIPSNLTSIVQPQFTLNSKTTFFLSLFIDFKTSQHEIKLFKK